MSIEKAIIGRMLMDKGAIPCAMCLLKASDFQSKKCAAMFIAMIELFNEGKLIDLVTLQDKLKEMGQNPDMASVRNMMEIMDNA